MSYLSLSGSEEYQPKRYPKVERWRPYVRRYLSGVPEDFVLAWIYHESGGRPGVRTSLDERGVLQIHPSEAQGMGLSTADFDFLLKGEKDTGYSADEHFRVSAKLVRYKEKSAKRYMTDLGMTFSGRDFWTLVKLAHGLPAIIVQGGKAFLAAHDRPPGRFTEFAAWLRFSKWTYKGWGTSRIDTILRNAENAGRWAPENLGLGLLVVGAGLWWLLFR